MNKSNQLFMPDFNGPIADQLRGFLEEKRALGYKYSTESWRLLQVDRLSKELNIPPNTLPKELIDAWRKRTPTENKKTWYARVCVTNELTKYFIAHDLPCFKTIISSGGNCDSAAFIPHIFTNEELRRLFDAADSLNVSVFSPHRRDVASLLFRILYSCGLRVSEALSLMPKDVDSFSGVITVMNGKGKVDRYVPMSQQLTDRCKEYEYSVLSEYPDSKFYFTSPRGERYGHSTIATMWDQILHAAGIPKNDDGPRIHDLRHTFAVHCLKKWVDEGKQVNSLLPVLSSYMGHISLDSVNKYLRLTSDVFPNITCQVEKYFGYIIPDGGYVNEEE